MLKIAETTFCASDNAQRIDNKVAGGCAIPADVLRLGDEGNAVVAVSDAAKDTTAIVKDDAEVAIGTNVRRGEFRSGRGRSHPVRNSQKSNDGKEKGKNKCFHRSGLFANR